MTEYTIKRAIRVPQLKMEEGHTYDVKFEDAMTEEPAKGRNAEGMVKLAKVTDLSDGETKQIIIGSVLGQLLADEGDYVGRLYRIGVGYIRAENSWRDYNLWEIAADST